MKAVSHFRKRIISLFVILVLLCTVLPAAPTWAASTQTINLLANQNGICTSVDLKAYLSNPDAQFVQDDVYSGGVLSPDGIYTAQKTGSDIVYAIRNKKIVKVFHINMTAWTAHRGYSTAFPENTATAFIAAAEAGADAIETDIRRTSDGVLVCFHDSDARSKTASNVRAIEDITYEEVQQLRYAGLPGGEEEPICLFEDFLNICHDYHVTPTLHMKVAPTEEQQQLAIEATAELIFSLGMEYEVSFLKDSVETDKLKEYMGIEEDKPWRVMGDEPPFDLNDPADKAAASDDMHQVLYDVQLGYETLEYTGEKRYQGDYLTVKGIRHYGSADGRNEVVTLTKNVDYSAVYTDNIDIGTATVKITGLGDWRGVLFKTFEITKIDLADALVTVTEPCVYDGELKTPALTVTKKISGKTLTFEEGVDYTIKKYSNNRKAGVATVTIKGKGICTGTQTAEFFIAAPLKSVKPAHSTLTYKGAPWTQSVDTVVKGNFNGKTKTLTYKTDYDITYKNNKNIGTATMIVTGKNQYAGTIKKTFKIVPEKTQLTSVTSSGGKMIVKWNKQTKQTTGYQILISTDSSFSKIKYVTIGKNTTTSKTITGLAKGQYYVRIRTYKTVDGKKYCSNLSTIKTVKL